MIIFVIPVILLVVIIWFASYANAHHFPATWEEVEHRKYLKKHGNGGQAFYPKSHHVIYDDDDEFEDDLLSGGDGDFSDSSDMTASDGEFYGEIPFGDGKIYMTDDDDFIDEFGDDVL